MALVATNEGEVEFFKHGLRWCDGTAYRLYFYTNDYTPVETSVWTDFTTALDGVGDTYMQSLTWSDWTISTDGSNVTSAVQPEITVSLGGGQTVYGYLVVYFCLDGSLDPHFVVMWAERFPDPIAISGGGPHFKFTPRVELD